MAKGYAEGPAAEEAERRREEVAAGGSRVGGMATRLAVVGATKEDAERHFLGWVGDVDPDELFESGAAWAITVTRLPATAGAPGRRPT